MCAAGGRRDEPTLHDELPVEDEDTKVPAVGNGAPRSKTVHGNPVSAPRNHAEQQEVILLDDLDTRELHGVLALHRRHPQYGSEQLQGAARAAQWYAQGEPCGCVSGSYWLAYTRCQPRAPGRLSTPARLPN